MIFPSCLRIGESTWRNRERNDAMVDKIANIYARIETEEKKHTDVLMMDAETLDIELEKGYVDMQADV